MTGINELISERRLGMNNLISNSRCSELKRMDCHIFDLIFVYSHNSLYYHITPLKEGINEVFF
jgi:hypothetical protein